MGNIKWLRVVIGALSVYFIVLMVFIAYILLGWMYWSAFQPVDAGIFNQAVSNSFDAVGVIVVLLSTFAVSWLAVYNLLEAKRLNGLLIGIVVWFIPLLLDRFSMDLLEILFYAAISLAGWLGGRLSKRRHEPDPDSPAA